MSGTRADRGECWRRLRGDRSSTSEPSASGCMVPSFGWTCFRSWTPPRRQCMARLVLVRMCGARRLRGPDDEEALEAARQVGDGQTARPRAARRALETRARGARLLPRRRPGGLGRGPRGARVVPQERPSEERHGVRRRPAPGPDPQGHAGGAAAARHGDAGRPDQGPDEGRAGPGAMSSRRTRTCRSCMACCTSSSRPRLAACGCRSTSSSGPWPTTSRTEHRRHSLGHGLRRHLGIRAIKEKAGAVFVQEPSSAKFDGMPRSAIDAGLADVVAPAEELPGKHPRSTCTHLPLMAKPEAALHEKDQGALEKIVVLLRAQTGHDFSHYKRAPSTAASSGAWASTSSPSIADYVRYLRENPQEIEAALQGAADRRDQLLPRPGGVGPAAGRGASPPC